MEIQDCIRQSAENQCVEFSVLAGLAQGKPIEEFGATLESAKQAQKEIVRLQCSGQGRTL